MKKNWIWLVVAIVIVLAALWLWKGDKLSQNGLTLFPGDSATPSPTPKPATPKTSVPGVANYTQLVNEYVGRRLQFNDKCQMTPVSPTFKNGTKIMLDNRSKDPKTVTINDVKYSLVGYGYQLVTLTSKTLPQTLNINCDSLVNAGKVLLQATISNQ